MALRIETKVGLFFLVGLVILGVITFKVADLSEIFKPKTHYKVFFKHAAGLNPDDTVAIAGLKVGKIERLELKDTGVEMTLAVESKERIRKDAVATIAWGGLLGGRYIDISLGSPDEEFLPPGSDIPTGPSPELTEIFAKINSVAATIQDLLKGSNGANKISALFDNVTKASQDIALITTDIRSGRGTVGKLIQSDELYRKALGIADDVKASSADIRKLLADNDDRLRSIMENLDAAIPEAKDTLASIKKTSESIKKTSDEANSGKGVVGTLLTDEKMAQDLRTALTRLSASLDRLDATMKNVQEGPGLVSRLINDPKLSNDVADAVQSARNIIVRVETGDNTIARLTRDKDLYEDVKKLLDDARETLRSVKEQVPVGTFASFLLTSF